MVEQFWCCKRKDPIEVSESVGPECRLKEGRRGVELSTTEKIPGLFSLKMEEFLIMEPVQSGPQIDLY